MKKTICVDLDGVLADYSQGWQGIDHIGDPLPGAVEFVKKLNKLGRVVIFTCRCNPAVNKDVIMAEAHVAVWLVKHDFEYDEICTERGKPIASAYIDDRAVYCNPDRAMHPLPSFPDPKGEIQARDLAAIWGMTLEVVTGLVERSDGFVSDSGITV